MESLESLYFTPTPARGQAPLETSLDSLGDAFPDSGRKTRSARRRTTQIINITMTKVRLLGIGLLDINTSSLSRAHKSGTLRYEQHLLKGHRFVYGLFSS